MRGHDTTNPLVMNRYQLSLLLVALAPALAGCPPETVPFRAKSSIERSYTLGTTATAAAGTPMVSVRNLTSAPLYEVAFDYTPPQHDPFRGGLDYPALTKGMRFVQVATRSDGTIGLMRSGYGVTRSASLGRDTYMAVTIWIAPDGKVATTMEGRPWTRDALFLPVRSSGTAAEAARVELVYDGFDGTMLAVTHREFYGDTSTPTVTRPLRFDLAASRTITHNGLTLEVIDAAPSAVEYRVVSDREMKWIEEPPSE